MSEWGEKKEDDDGDRSYLVLSSLLIALAGRSSQRQTEMPIPIFSFSPGQQQQVPQLSRKAKLRCVVALCLCVCAGRHSWWWPASSGRRPSGRPPVAFGRGRGIDGCRTQQRSGRGKVRGDELSRSTRSTYYCIRSTRTGYRQAAGPGPNPVCLWIGRTRSLR